jgi:phosphatidylserine/phosphatidylglycerophosphate/cardiolipin synthase-like enzyme
MALSVASESTLANPLVTLARAAYRETGHDRAPEGGTHVIPAAGTLEVGYSPNQGAEGLVIKLINAARVSIKIAAYSYTNRNITNALLAAKQRGVKVWMVADYKDNLVEGSVRQAVPLFDQLVAAGCEVRIDHNYPIFHDKFITVDDTHQETGSFNFTESAATRNAENVLVNWNNPALAQVYAAQWGTLYVESTVYRPGAPN